MIQTLQSLRFIFVMLIFLSHFAYGDIRAFDAGGDCGVAFFFLLSGFVLTLGYGRQISDGSFSYGAFMKRRLLKLYPLHLLCLLFFLVVSRSAIGMPTVLNFLLLQSWIPNPDYYFSCNSVSWFLSSILFCYAVFPFFYRRLTVGWLVAILSAYAVVYFLVPDSQVNAILYVNPLVRFVDFYIGMFLCRNHGDRLLDSVQNHEPVPVIPKSAGWMEPLLLLLLFVALLAYPYAGVKFRNAPLYWLVLIPLILCFAREQGIVSRLLRTRPMRFLATLTMPLFLTHQLIIGILQHRLSALLGEMEGTAVAMLFVCIVVTLTVSWAINLLLPAPKASKKEK